MFGPGFGSTGAGAGAEPEVLEPVPALGGLAIGVAFA